MVEVRAKEAEQDPESAGKVGWEAMQNLMWVHSMSEIENEERPRYVESPPSQSQALVAKIETKLREYNGVIPSTYVLNQLIVHIDVSHLPY